jgi:hypothetical protein
MAIGVICLNDLKIKLGLMLFLRLLLYHVLDNNIFKLNFAFLTVNERLLIGILGLAAYAFNISFRCYYEAPHHAK